MIPHDSTYQNWIPRKLSPIFLRSSGHAPLGSVTILLFHNSHLSRDAQCMLNAFSPTFYPFQFGLAYLSPYIFIFQIINLQRDAVYDRTYPTFLLWHRWRCNASVALAGLCAFDITVASAQWYLSFTLIAQLDLCILTKSGRYCHSKSKIHDRGVPARHFQLLLSLFLTRVWFIVIFPAGIPMFHNQMVILEPSIEIMTQFA